ncbi:hypothetical protein [Halomonas sp. LBP4]|uniref:hypothetical protein n=1 Tax=Halomonas sp. LBP4 TaxID=2044917 RepID=UPI0011B65B2F|nr:hypothetical protein [Halomonas sp. LBP4]
MTRIQLATWKRCNIEGLSIVPSLCGESHDFYFRDHRYVLRLPRKPKLKNGKSTSQDIKLTSWRKKQGRTVPLKYTVHRIDIILDHEKELAVPGKSLGKVDPCTFPKRKQKQLERLVTKSEESILEAFEYWKQIVRWKTGNSGISPPFESNLHHGWSSYLIDLKTEQRFYAAPHVMVVLSETPITKRQWNAVGAALTSQALPPIWEKFYIEAHHRRGVHDYHGAVISLAVAIESSVRCLMERHVREPPNDEFEKMVNRINLSQILDRWKQLGFNSASWVKSFDKKWIKYIVDTRNGIMHRGLYEAVDSVALHECFRAARIFLDKVANELSSNA